MGRVLNNQFKKITNSFLNNTTYDKSYREEVYEELQYKIDEEFKYASDVWEIEREINGVWFELEVRMTNPYTLQQSTSIRDDFKVIIFKNQSTEVVLGDLFRFNGYTYICTDVGKSLYPTASCMVQRCADHLRFYDNSGLYHELPCVVQKGSFYDLKKDTHVMIPDNQVRILVRYDEESKLIKWADINSSDDKFTRFILEEYAYRAVSIDRHSFVRLGVGYIDIRLQSDQISPNDDLVNGIADANVSVSIDIQNGESLTIGESQTVQLNTTINVNGVELSNPVITYTSSDESVATVDSSGLVTTITSGSATITAQYSNASDSIDITVDILPVDNYTVEIASSNNNIDSIKLGQTLVYTASSLNNGDLYTISGTWELFEDDGTTPLSTDIISVLDINANVITLKCSTNFDYVDTVFKLKYSDANANSTLDITIESLF